MTDDTDLRRDAPETPVEPSPEETQEPAPARPEAEERYQNLQSALAEERYRRAQQSQELAALRSQVEQFGTLREELEAYRKQVRQEEEDPVTELKREIKGLSERYNQDQQASLQERQALAQRLELENQVRSQVSEFMKRKPDYQNAYNYVVNRRQADYQKMGVPPQLWGQRLESEVSGLLNEARLYGGNAAEILYGLAENWGYRPPQQATQAQEPVRTERFLDEGPSSLSDIGGRADTALSLKNISTMSDEDFDKFWEGYKKASRGR
jgi:hypothetical protein